jgi:hypothetical protein
MTWTDDLSLRVARGETLVSLVDYVLDSKGAARPWPEVRGVLTERFALSYDDARLAMDRVAGGQVRAATSSPSNEPDAVKDPVAWISYRRARGLPVEPPPPIDRSRTIADAAALVRRARATGELLGTANVDLALAVVELVVTRVAEAPTEDDPRALLVQAATVVSSAAEALIDACGSARCAPAGSQAWVDGVALAAAAAQLTQRFADRGWPDLARRGLALRGTVVTGLLGQCHARVGAVMLDDARAAREAGDDADAAGKCDAVIADFVAVVEAWEDTPEPPFDEHRIAIEHLRDALDLRAAMSADGLGREHALLRARCERLLTRAPAGELSADPHFV